MEIPESKMENIIKISNTAAKKLGLSRINFVFSLKKSLGEDVNVNYRKVHDGKVWIEIGPKALKPFGKKDVYHEMMHVKDALEKNLDFSDNLKGETLRMKIIASIVLNFSVDGRLDKMKLPHIGKNERLKITADFLSKKGVKTSRTETRRILKKLWGKNLKKKEVLLSARRLNSVFF